MNQVTLWFPELNLFLFYDLHSFDIGLEREEQCQKPTNDRPPEKKIYQDGRWSMCTIGIE